MTDRAITATWNGERFVLPPISRMKCKETLQPNEAVVLEVKRPRHLAMHRRFMAMVADYHSNLPEHLADAPFAASPDHLRKYALIRCGFADTTTHTAKSEAEALRVEETFQSMRGDTFALVYRQGLIVCRSVALSQAFAAMNQKSFKQSSEHIEEFLATLVGGKRGEAA